MSDGWNDDFWRSSAERPPVSWPGAIKALAFYAAVCFIVYLLVTH